MDRSKIQEKVLEDLMKDMDEFEFEKKLKPKLLTITIDAGGASPEMEGEEEAEDMEGELDFMSMLEGGDEEAPKELQTDDEMDPRLKKKLSGLGG